MADRSHVPRSGGWPAHLATSWRCALVRGPRAADVFPAPENHAARSAIACPRCRHHGQRPRDFVLRHRPEGGGSHRRPRLAHPAAVRPRLRSCLAADHRFGAAAAGQLRRRLRRRDRPGPERGLRGGLRRGSGLGGSATRHRGQSEVLRATDRPRSAGRSGADRREPRDEAVGVLPPALGVGSRMRSHPARCTSVSPRTDTARCPSLVTVRQRSSIATTPPPGPTRPRRDERDLPRGGTHTTSSPGPHETGQVRVRTHPGAATRDRTAPTSGSPRRVTPRRLADLPMPPSTGC